MERYKHKQLDVRLAKYGLICRPLAWVQLVYGVCDPLTTLAKDPDSEEVHGVTGNTKPIVAVTAVIKVILSNFQPATGMNRIRVKGKSALQYNKQACREARPHALIYLISEDRSVRLLRREHKINNDSVARLETMAECTLHSW